MKCPTVLAHVNRFERVVDTVKQLDTRYVRTIMALLKRDDITPDHLLTQHGFTMGEFCTAYVLGSKKKRKPRAKSKS